jgi:hypothetical protein
MAMIFLAKAALPYKAIRKDAIINPIASEIFLEDRGF